MSNADDKDSVSSAAPQRITYPRVLLDRVHEVSFSPLSGWWFVSIIGSEGTVTASAKTLREAAKAVIAKARKEYRE